MKTYNQLIQTETFWTNKIQNDLYNIIHTYMKDKGLTQTQLAEELGFSKGYISQVLNGNFNHKLDKLVSLALAVGKVPNLTFQDVGAYVKEQEREFVKQKYGSMEPIHVDMNARASYRQGEKDIDPTIAPNADQSKRKFAKEYSYSISLKRVS